MQAYICIPRDILLHTETDKIGFKTQDFLGLSLPPYAKDCIALGNANWGIPHVRTEKRCTGLFWWP